MKQIAGALATAREQGRLAFIPYLTAGDPDPETTVVLVKMLAAEGADIVELGVPFSDPLADGVTNQRAAERALAGGMTLSGVLDLVQEIRTHTRVPLVLFSYFNPIYRMGIERFSRRAASEGVDGVLVTDLPPDEGESYRALLSSHGLDPIFMLSPTSSPARIRLVAAKTAGFIYYISRTGVTGAHATLSPGLRADVARLRLHTSLPVAVGFGVSRPEHLEALAGAADAVVVGSALVKVIESAGKGSSAVEAARTFVRGLLGRPTG
ncbi:MAG: tryptophan synthase subunit alpha [Acidobacteriota bacterium]